MSCREGECLPQPCNLFWGSSGPSPISLKALGWPESGKKEGFTQILLKILGHCFLGQVLPVLQVEIAKCWEEPEVPGTQGFQRCQHHLRLP